MASHLGPHLWPLGGQRSVENKHVGFGVTSGHGHALPFTGRVTWAVFFPQTSFGVSLPTCKMGLMVLASTWLWEAVP